MSQLVLIYLGMLTFDSIVLGGTAYLIAERGWSAWWILLAVLMAAGSNPRPLINAIKPEGDAP
ncbi:MAG: hypothetical protein WA191_07205 [Telluria sp.]